MKYSLIIIGSGPAGYTAGVYAARAELKPILFSGEKNGGQLMNTAMVENWPGYKDGIMGPDLMMEMRKQAQKFGAQVIDKNVTRVDFSGLTKKVWVGDPSTALGAGQEHEARAVIIATGAASIRLNVPGEERLMGKGVAICAVCDAPFYKEKTVFVIGGGDGAVEDAMALTKFSSKVYLVHRRDELRASKVMAKRAKENSKIEILWNRELKEVVGEQKVEKIKLFNNKDNKEEEMEADGVFLAIGHKPVTEMFERQLDMDEKGFITIRHVYPESTRTSVEGVFAAGDVVDYRYKQAVTAAGMGCQAALDAEKYLEGL